MSETVIESLYSSLLFLLFQSDTQSVSALTITPQESQAGFQPVNVNTPGIDVKEIVFNVHNFLSDITIVTSIMSCYYLFFPYLDLFLNFF